MIRIATVSLPPEKSKGGIDAAILGIQEATAGDELSFVSSVEDADIVHFHGLWQLRHARLSAKLRKEGKPYIVSPHGMLEPWAFNHKAWKKLPYFSLIEKAHLEGASRLFVTSDLEKANVLELLTHDSVDVLPLGCTNPQEPNYDQARKKLGWKDDEVVLLYLSRIHRKKGLHLLLQALANLDSDSTKVRLVVIGSCDDEDYQAELDQILAERSQDLPKMDWLGPMWGSEKWTYLQAADLYCLTTHSENFGVSVLEALHVGTPVLTTTGTPWKDHKDLQGFQICEPEELSISESLKTFFQQTQAPDSRQLLASWTKNHFAWSVLRSQYYTSYNHCVSQ